MKHRIFVVVMMWSSLLGSIAVPDSHAQPDSADREIVELHGSLYRVRVGEQHTVFLHTPEGIVLVDPISIEVAQWLKQEFERRFPPGIVKYILHTNHHFDRAEGAQIFTGAQFIGQREFNGAVAAARREGAPSIAVSDRVRARDRNGDGRVTSEELYVRVRDVKLIFDDSRVVSLGGRTIELMHAPTDLAPDNTIVNFVSERTAFASEAPPFDPTFTFGTWKANNLKRWLAAAASLEFDTLALADGSSVNRTQITARSAYVNDLFRRVLDEYEAGRSADEFAESKVPQAYRSDATFGHWRANVSDIFAGLHVFRIEATIGALGHYAVRDAAYCSSFITCSTGGLVPGGTASVSVGAGRWAAVGEVSITDESFTAHTSRFVDEEFALVEARTSFMARYTRPVGAVSYRFLGGMSYTVGDRRGMNRVKGGLPPFAGRHPIQSHDTRWGYTGGFDLVLGRSLGIAVPLRFNYAARDASGTFPNRMDAQAGIAVTLRVFRLVH
jgi:glyoxylase-like metal-dependent hydrolase (beta-lactamase superfamily II)